MDDLTIGENIRAAREALGVSITLVAQRAGITKSALSKIEKGQTSPPVSTLLQIAKALGVKLGSFFSEENESPRYVLTRKGKGKVIVRGGTQFGYSYEALALDFPNKGAEPFLLTVCPGDTEGKFRHGGDEFIYILSGKVEFHLGPESMELKPGDSIYFDPSLKHFMRVLGNKPVRYLCVFIDRPTESLQPHQTNGK